MNAIGKPNIGGKTGATLNSARLAPWGPSGELQTERLFILLLQSRSTHTTADWGWTSILTVKEVFLMRHDGVKICSKMCCVTAG